MGAGKFASIDDPMSLRVDRLRQNGIIFSFENLYKRVLWSDNAGYDSGVIFSGRRSKGDALRYFLDNIAKYKPQRIVFVDDNVAWLKSVNSMCEQMGINFVGFHYKAAVFDKDEELCPEVAKFQLQMLYEKGVWMDDDEARKIVAERKKS
jgi:hypothetical protein